MADSPPGPAPGGAHSPHGPNHPDPSSPAGPTNVLSPERYLAWLYSPREQQPVLAALCQIEAEVAASLRSGIDHHVAHARLQWWREECERTAQGRPVHPLTRELFRALGSRTGAGASSSAKTGYAAKRSERASSSAIGGAAQPSATTSSGAIGDAGARSAPASAAVGDAADGPASASSAAISSEAAASAHTSSATIGDPTPKFAHASSGAIGDPTPKSAHPSSGAIGGAGARSAPASAAVGDAADGPASASLAATGPEAAASAHASSATSGDPTPKFAHASSGAIGGAGARSAPASAAVGGATGEVAPSSAAIAGISGFVDTAVWDLAGATFETRKELTAYCERWSVAMFGTAVPNRWSEAAHAARLARVVEQVAAGQGGVRTETGTSVAPSTLRVRELGAAVREIELLAGLAREAHAGRLRVPLDELERAGVDVSSLAKTPWPPALVNLLRKRHEALRETLVNGVSQLQGDEQAPVRGLLVWAALAWRLSLRSQRALPNVVQPRRYHALSDGWHAWRAAHRATAGRLRLAHNVFRASG